MYRKELEREARLIAEGQQLFVASLAARWRAFRRLLMQAMQRRHADPPPPILMI
jgi:hypothetical protein